MCNVFCGTWWFRSTNGCKNFRHWTHRRSKVIFQFFRSKNTRLSNFSVFFLRTWTMILVTMFCVIPMGLLRDIDSLAAVCTASIGFYFCLVVKVSNKGNNPKVPLDLANMETFKQTYFAVLCCMSKYLPSNSLQQIKRIWVWERSNFCVWERSTYAEAKLFGYVWPRFDVKIFVQSLSTKFLLANMFFHCI